ncbi:MAG TPA: UbiX family flavin prenyltransferase [Chloroflexota bacterium]|nr:UbiX family flavin prenyltransferase [Chloroflexota bacterium]
MSARRPVVVGITGASGHLLARRCVERLLGYSYPILLVCTGPGRRVWSEELDEELPAVVERWRDLGTVTQYHVSDIGAPIASGGLVTHGMLVAPCSMGTLAGIATGAAGNLLERAADVTVKEYRPLVLVPRETPLSPIHLQNMLDLARIGVRIVPPMPAFYLRPKSVDEVVEHLAVRVLSALGVPEALDEPPAYQTTSIRAKR